MKISLQFIIKCVGKKKCISHLVPTFVNYELMNTNSKNSSLKPNIQRLYLHSDTTRLLKNLIKEYLYKNFE